MLPYVSIDIETTGLDPEKCQIIEFAAVIDNWHDDVYTLPVFSTYISHEIYTGEAYALSMHADIFRKIATQKNAQGIKVNIIYERDLIPQFHNFLISNNITTVLPAGKNFNGFDRQFLKKLPHWDYIKMTHRAIDVGNLFWVPGEDIPNSDECLRRSNTDKWIEHTALADAIDMVKLIRYHWKNKQ